MTGIIELAIVILIATVLGMVARFLKQPLILAFIATGVIISASGLLHPSSQETFQLFSDIGIMLLLFLVGLEIDLNSLKLISKTSVLIGLLHGTLTIGLGFLLAKVLGFGLITAGYLAVALSFSSTIIVIKLLSEKKDTNSLYGKITTGILLTQDFLAVLALIFLSGFESGGAIVWTSVLLTILKGIVIFALALIIGRKIIPLIFDRLAYSQELLFLGSIGWAFLLAAVVSHPKIGFPLEVSGLLAGLALSNSPENIQIFSKLKYLRDFFIVIFFVILGTSLVSSNIGQVIVPVIALSLFVLLIKPLLMLVVMGFLGYRKKTGFLTGVTSAQISEFSLVLAAVGLKLGHINNDVAALITSVGIITIAVSVYLIMYADKIYQRLSPILKIFQKKNLKEKMSENHVSARPIILIGSHRLGQSIAFSLKREDVLIVDFDPEVIQQLKSHDYAYLFGDITDEEIAERANLAEAKVVISTVPDFKDNVKLLEKIKILKRSGSQLKTIIRAETENEVEELYREGADYVLFPHFTSGHYLGKSLAIDPDMKIIEDLRRLDLKILRKLERRNSN